MLSSRSLPADSAGRLVHWRSGTTAAPSVARSTTIRASAAVCIGSPSQLMRRSDAQHRGIAKSVTLQSIASGHAAMIDHVSVAVSDLDQGTRFYEAVLGVIGFRKLETR